MTAAKSEPTVAEFRAWMTRTPIDGDRCTCGAVFGPDRWTSVLVPRGHFRCYARFRGSSE